MVLTAVKSFHGTSPHLGTTFTSNLYLMILEITEDLKPSMIHTVRKVLLLVIKSLVQVLNTLTLK